MTVASPVVFGAADPRFSLEYQVAAGDWRRDVLPVCRCERFEDALPVRQFHFEKGLETATVLAPPVHRLVLVETGR